VGAGIFILIVLVIAVVAFLQWQAKQRRREAVHEWAVRNGFAYSVDDPIGIPQRFSSFGFMNRGEGRGCENVLQGTWQDLPVIEADYWTYTTSTDSEGRTSRDYDHFSIVIVEIAAWLPGVTIERENVLTRLADHVGFRDIEFELEEFNRRFNVKCQDREFAYKLLDARMMQYLLDKAGQVCVEVNGGHALVWQKRIGVEGLMELLYRAKGFVDNVPRLVWNEYGKAAS